MSSAIEIRHPVEFAALFEEAINVAVLTRSLDDGVARGAASFAAGSSAALRLVVGASSSGRDALVERLGGPLGRDVFRWVELMVDLSGAELAGVRLARLEAAMCPRFHVDRVAVRLVSTYLGRGTEYAHDEDIDRTRLNHRVSGADALRPGARVYSARAGDVALLKGEAWPDNEGRGAVHRSPRASPVEPRLVLTIDAL